MICHTHNFQISGRGCQILPWSWQSRSFLTRISHRPPEGRTTPRTTPGKARMGLLGEGGVCMSSPCTAPLGWAWLEGKHTASCPARGALAHLSPERQGERGRTKGGIGSTPVMQSGPPLLHRLFPKSDPPYGSSASIPLTWFSVSARSPLLGSGFWNMDCSQGQKYVLCPKKLVCMPVQGAWPGTPLAIDARHLSILTKTCECVRNGRKWVRAIWTALNSRPFMCQARYLPDQTP